MAAERKAVQPILPGSFMKRGAFILSVLALFLTQGLMQANMTNTIVFVNYTQPDNTAVSGYAISVMYVGMSLGAVILGPLADRFEPKHVLTGSLILTGIGCGIDHRIYQGYRPCLRKEMRKRRCQSLYGGPQYRASTGDCKYFERCKMHVQ